MRSDDIAALLVAGMQPSYDLDYHQGLVLSWDEATGNNSVMVNGSTFTNLLVLSTGAITPFQKGDTLGILRYQSTYFILGKIRAPGAGAGERIASAKVAQLITVPTGGGYADLAGSFGPEVSLFVGSSRRALVIHSVEIAHTGSVTVDASGAFARASAGQGVQISGATIKAPETAVTSAGYQGRFGTSGVFTATSLVTSAQGLNSGTNTFTCKYKATADAGVVPNVNNRTLTVIPF